MKRRQMGKVKRPEIINSARKVGRREAIKRRSALVNIITAFFNSSMQPWI